MPKALIVTSLTHNPWHNLALEEHLFQQLSEAVRHRQNGEAGIGPDAILYLWQNDQTVVIGRNQNAWAECNTARLEADGGFLARRTTGGGAVFHDLGNLCYSILLPQDRFDLDRNFQMLTDMLNREGIPAVRSGRNDILVDGLKFSGNAFRLNHGVGLHHGTMMVHSEFTRLAQYLTVSPTKLQAKGIASVRSRVINLVEVRPDLSIAHMFRTLEKAFLDAFCQPLQDEGAGGTNDNAVFTVDRRTDRDYQDESVYRALCDNFSSWEWRYGRTLQFDAQVEERFSWGHVQIGLTVKGGHVQDVHIYSDALDSDFIDRLAECLKGRLFHSEDLVRAVESLASGANPFGIAHNAMVSDIAALFLAQGW